MPRRDPRLDQIPKTVNEAIADRSVRHALFLEKLKAGEVRRILALYDQALPDLLDRIELRLNRIAERGFDPGPATTERLQQMAAAIDKATRELRQESQAVLTSDMIDLAKDEAQFQLGVVRQSLPVSFDMVLPSTQTLRSVVTARPFDGRLLKDWFRGLETAQRTGLRQAIRLGITEGETTAQIVRRIRGTRAANFTDGVVGLNRRQAEAVVRSAVTHVSSHAREATFEANTDLVKGVQWIITLDSRACIRCARRADHRTRLGVGVYPVGSGPRPPEHLACRCTTSPVTKSWKELGIDLKEAPPGTRASMDGQVADDITFGDWLKDQTPDIQDKALGRKWRGREFRAGRLEVTEFTDTRGNELTMEQLRVEEADVL